MTKQQTILSGALAGVGFLGSAFGGFKVYSAPPANPLGSGEPRLLVGIASFAVLVILLLAAALAAAWAMEKHRTVWSAASVLLIIVFIGCSMAYYRYAQRVSFRYPNVDGAAQYHVGNRYTPEAQAFLDHNPNLSVPQLIQEFGGFEMVTSIWPPDAIHEVHWRLSALYLAMMISLSAAVFALVELVAGFVPLTGKTPAPPAEPSDKG